VPAVICIRWKVALGAKEVIPVQVIDDPAGLFKSCRKELIRCFTIPLI